MSVSTYTPGTNKIVHKAKVDFKLRPIEKAVKLVQYDKNLPIIAVDLYLDGAPYTIPVTADVKIRWGKKDRTFVYKNVLGCNSGRTTVYFDVDEQMSFHYGELNPILEIKVGNEVAGSSPIPVTIDRNPFQEDDIESSSQYIDLDQAVLDAQNAANQAIEAKDDAEAARDTAQNLSDDLTENYGNIRTQVAENTDGIDRLEEAVNKLDLSLDKDTRSGEDILSLGADVIATNGQVLVEGVSLYAKQELSLSNDSITIGSTINFTPIQSGLSIPSGTKIYITYKQSITLTSNVRNTPVFSQASPNINQHLSVSTNYGLAAGTYSHILILSNDLNYLHHWGYTLVPNPVTYSNYYLFNITTLILNKQYSPLYNKTFNLMTDAEIKLQMDKWVNDGVLPNNEIQSVGGSKRVKSVSQDESISNDLYLDSLSNLNRLPNGVKDTIEYRNGKYYYIKRVGTAILNGSENWSAYSELTNVSVSDIELTGSIVSSPLNSVFVKNFTHIISANDDSEHYYISSANRFRLYIEKAKLPTKNLAEFKTWLSSNNVSVLYQLATPVETEITSIGTLLPQPNGTVYVTNEVAEVGIYDNGFTTTRAISEITELYKLNNDGSKTKLSGATIVGNSFTHASLVSGDLVFVSYIYNALDGYNTITYKKDNIVRSSRKINGKDLSSDRTLLAKDIPIGEFGSFANKNTEEALETLQTSKTDKSYVDAQLLLKQNVISDSGWIELSLLNGATGTVQVRKVGAVVTVIGNVTFNDNIAYAARAYSTPGGFHPKANSRQVITNASGSLSAKYLEHADYGAVWVSAGTFTSAFMYTYISA